MHLPTFQVLVHRERLEPEKEIGFSLGLLKDGLTYIFGYLLDSRCLHVNISHTTCILLLLLFDLILGTALAYWAFAISLRNRIAKSAEIHFLSEYLSYLSHAAIDLDTCLGRGKNRNVIRKLRTS